MPSNFIDLTGQRFGRLIVLKRADNDKSGRTQWRCLCNCGNIVVRKSYRLRAGETQSCGCYNKDRIRDEKTKHGMTGTPEYRTWKSIKSRCYRSSDNNYQNYGGRGIAVCERWHDFKNFFEDMGNKPTPEHSIDRIDNNGNYEPRNCRWATRIDQARNKRVNTRLTYAGKTQTLKEWADEAGVSASSLCNRLYKLNWSIERALTERMQGARQELKEAMRQGSYACSTRAITFNGKTQAIEDWADEIGVTHSTLYYRLKKYGWSIERALTTPILSRK